MATIIFLFLFYFFQEEEAEWLGLTIEEAVEKGREIEEALNQPIPLKYKLAKALAYRLQGKGHVNQLLSK